MRGAQTHDPLFMTGIVQACYGDYRLIRAAATLLDLASNLETIHSEKHPVDQHYTRFDIGT